MGSNHATEFTRLLRNAQGAGENKFGNIEDAARSLPNDKRDDEQKPRGCLFKSFFVHNITCLLVDNGASLADGTNVATQLVNDVGELRRVGDFQVAWAR